MTPHPAGLSNACIRGQTPTVRGSSHQQDASFHFIFILQPAPWLQSRHCLVQDVFE